jgi:hypothetical protein
MLKPRFSPGDSLHRSPGIAVDIATTPLTWEPTTPNLDSVMSHLRLCAPFFDEKQSLVPNCPFVSARELYLCSKGGELTQ